MSTELAQDIRTKRCRRMGNYEIGYSANAMEHMILLLSLQCCGRDFRREEGRESERGAKKGTGVKRLRSDATLATPVRSGAQTSHFLALVPFRYGESMALFLAASQLSVGHFLHPSRTGEPSKDCAHSPAPTKQGKPQAHRRPLPSPQHRLHRSRPAELGKATLSEAEKGSRRETQQGNLQLQLERTNIWR